jgi:hypothetical protein
VTVSLSLSDVGDIEFPPWVDRATVLKPLRTETWRRSAQYRRDITRTSPLLFAITYLPHRLRHPVTGGISFIPMHLEMCMAARDWRNPGQQLRAFIAPRGSGKTTWPFQILPVWALGHEHVGNFLAFAYVAAQARKTHLRNLLNELKTNELIRHDFPGLIPRRGQSALERTVLENGATIAAFGMTETSLGWQDAQGRRPRIMIGDDLEPGEKNTLDEVERNKFRLLHDVLPMGDGRAAVWVTGTTTMHNSMIHGFVHAAKGRPEGDWVRRMGFDARHWPALDEQGRSWWPQNRSAEELRELRDADPHGFDLNYQNDPRPDADMTFWTPEIFRTDPHFQAVDRVLYIDPAETTGPDSDFTAMVLLSRDASRQRACVEQVAWGRWTDPEIRTRIHDFCAPFERHKPQVQIEGNRGGTTRLDSLAPWPEGVRYEMVRHDGTPKFSRIRRAHSLYYARKVWHLDELPQFEAELCRWPRSKHDDVADAVAGALEWAFPVPKSK